MLVHGFCFFKLVFIGPKELRVRYKRIAKGRWHADMIFLVFCFPSISLIGWHALMLILQNRLGVPKSYIQPVQKTNTSHTRINYWELWDAVPLRTQFEVVYNNIIKEPLALSNNPHTDRHAQHNTNTHQSTRRPCVLKCLYYSYRPHYSKISLYNNFLIQKQKWGKGSVKEKN